MPRDVPAVRPEQSHLNTPNPGDTDAGGKSLQSPLLVDGLPDLGDQYEVQRELGRVHRGWRSIGHRLVPVGR